jgi:mannitol-1-/sugar-/sorbitol-6-phosphatase
MMPIIRCSALLFDMDGVLIDSTPAVARVWRRFAREHGLDPEEVINRAHGRPTVATMRDYFPNEDFVQMSREQERQEIADLEGVVALPGALTLLSELPAMSWTVVTSATRVLAEVRLRAAGLPVPQRFVTADDVQNGKPHPEPYLRAACGLGFAASECLVLEDVPAGIRAGKAAGSKVIALTTTVEKPELIIAGADWVLDHCGDVRVIPKSNALSLELRLPDD